MTASQLGFGFDEDALAPLTVTPATRARKARVARPEQLPQAASAHDPETMARELELHPDYRVLRRLVPSTEFRHQQGLSPVL